MLSYKVRKGALLMKIDNSKRESYSSLQTEELVRRLKAAESLARVQTAKLKNQVARFHKLESAHESLNEELQAQEERFKNLELAYDSLNDELQNQDERFESALAQEKRQKELVLSQMADLEQECMRLMEEHQVTPS